MLHRNKYVYCCRRYKALVKMIDKDWLERVTIAYKVYTREVGPSYPIEHFIDWLYKQYGIVKPEKDD